RRCRPRSSSNCPRPATPPPATTTTRSPMPWWRSSAAESGVEPPAVLRDVHTLRSRGAVGAARSALDRRVRSLYARCPAPVRHAWRLTDRTVRAASADRVPGLAAEAALFTLISLPALLLAVFGSLGYIAEALGPDGTEGLRRLVLDVPQSFLTEETFGFYAVMV